MKQIFRLTLVLAFVVIVFGSCKKATTLNPAQTEMEFSKAGGELQIPVGSDGHWSIENCPEWLKAKATDTALVCKVEPNTTGASRECTLVLAGAENVRASVIVRQADKCTHIDASPSVVTIPKEGGSETVIISTDGAHLDINVSDGITAEFNNNTLTVSAPANEGVTKHGTIAITCEDISKEIIVNVEGNICPTCGGSGKIRCPKCKGKGWYPIDVAGGGAACERCGGRWNGFTDDSSDWKDGTGRITCPTCGGAGH